jgi:hypothetical protein
MPKLIAIMLFVYKLYCVGIIIEVMNVVYKTKAKTLIIIL